MHDNCIARDPARAPASASCRSRRIKWRYASPIIFVHLVAVLACAPWFFSRTGIGVCAVGMLRFRHARHEYWLPSASDAPRLFLPAMDGALTRHSRRLLHGRVADGLGCTASPASSRSRPRARPAQPAGELSVGARRLADDQEQTMPRLGHQSKRYAKDLMARSILWVAGIRRQLGIKVRAGIVGDFFCAQGFTGA